MTDSGPFRYDHVFYPGHAFEQTHPARLSTMASLSGMTPAPLRGCRVLELGCGAGANLIPMAAQLPESEFVGIDLSDATVAKSARQVADLGLKNIALSARDIMDLTPEFGCFDYIIAHGVYSWVPPFVRAKMMAIFKENLSQNGVAYVSYNCYPGCRLRDLARDIMLFHVRTTADPQERLDQARGLMKVMAETSDNDVYGVVVREQWERLKKVPDPVLYHDDLDADSKAFLFHEVIDEAARHGLQYLSEASVHANPLGVAEPIRKILDRFPETEVVLREQYLDFFVGRGFRHTLLCHEEIELKRTADPNVVRNYHLAADPKPIAAEIDPSTREIAEFQTAHGNIAIDHPLTKAALLALRAAWPRALTFDEVVEDALSILGEKAAPIRANLEEEVDALTKALFRMFSAGTIAMHLNPPRLTTTIGERPRASLLARKQAENGALLTNLLHGAVSLEHPIVRRFLILLDGSRTVEELVADLNASLARDPPPGGEEAGDGAPMRVTRAQVEQNLHLAAKLALLEA